MGKWTEADLLRLHGIGPTAIPLLRADERWKKMALVSLVLTFSSGLMAIAFWSMRRDFDLSWWLPNLYLMLYPIYYIKKLLEEKNE